MIFLRLGECRCNVLLQIEFRGGIIENVSVRPVRHHEHGAAIRIVFQSRHGGDAAKVSSFAEVVENHRTVKSIGTSQSPLVRISVMLSTEWRDGQSNPGFRAVEIIPEVKAGAAIARITLMKGETSKMIESKLE